MLGLRLEIGGAKRRIGALVGDDQHLARAGRKIDPDHARDEQLGRGRPALAWPDDLVHALDRLGAVGERRDRLGAADAVDLVQPELTRGGENRRVELRGRHGDPPHAGGLSRHGAHHERARKRRQPARHVHPDRVERNEAALGLDAGIGRVAEVLRPLALVEGAYRADALAQRRERTARPPSPARSPRAERAATRAGRRRSARPARSSASSPRRRTSSTISSARGRISASPDALTGRPFPGA